MSQQIGRSNQDFAPRLRSGSFQVILAIPVSPDLNKPFVQYRQPFPSPCQKPRQKAAPTPQRLPAKRLLFTRRYPISISALSARARITKAASDMMLPVRRGLQEITPTFMSSKDPSTSDSASGSSGAPPWLRVLLFGTLLLFLPPVGQSICPSPSQTTQSHCAFWR